MSNTAENKKKAPVSPGKKWFNRILNVALVVLLGYVIYSRGPMIIAYFDSTLYQEEGNILSGELAIENEESVQEDLQEMEGTVTLRHYSRPGECPECERTEELYRKLADLSEKVVFEPRILSDNLSLLALQEVDKAPALVVIRDSDNNSNFRFFGLPAGYEFGTIVRGIENAGTTDNLLSSGTLARLSNLTEPVHVKIFVTRGCMFCAPHAQLASKFAFSSPNVVVDIIEIENFPYYVGQYNLEGFPSTVINDKVHMGMKTERDLLNIIVDS